MVRPVWIAAAAALLPAPALAQPVIVADSGDSAWVLAAAVVTLFAALPGLALFHGRGRIGPSGLALFVTASSVSLLFAIIGYSLAFGPGSAVIGGLSNALLLNLAELQEGATISEAVYVFFQMAMAVLATGIMVASIAERARLAWLIGFAPLWLLLVYVPLARWVMGGGWLAELGAVDFAGGLIVHAVPGIAAFIIAMMLGLTVGRQVAHDSRLAIAGVALSWIGILGLIGGAAFGAGEPAAVALINAQLAASAAGLAGAALERRRSGTMSFYGAATATISGLAAVSAGAAYVGVPGAIGLGLVGALASHLTAGVVRSLSMGSAASAFVIHGGAGCAGALAFPLFVLPALGGPGVEAGESLMRLALAQLVALGTVAIWTIVVTALAALTVSILVPMRRSERV